MSESVEVQLARISEQLMFVLAEQVESKATRKEQYQSIEFIKNKMTSIDSRVGKLEDGFNKNAPTIEEFITIKHKVVGAGAAGKYLWVIGGLILGAVGWFRQSIGL